MSWLTVLGRVVAQAFGIALAQRAAERILEPEVTGGAEAPREPMDSRWQYFTFEELRCRGKDCCGGEMRMDPEFMSQIVAIRRQLGFPFPVTSAYRCPKHNQRVATTGPDGPHTTGLAIDIAVSGRDAMRLLEAALTNHYFTGIGVHQRGEGRFIHLDALKGPMRPTVWSY